MVERVRVVRGTDHLRSMCSTSLLSNSKLCRAALHPAEARSAPSIMSCIQCIPVSFGASMLQRAAHSIYTYFSLFV